MAFPSGLYTDRPEKERGNCRQQETAVQCWFTAKGTAMPLILEKEEAWRWLACGEGTEEFLRRRPGRLEKEQEYQQLSLF